MQAQPSNLYGANPGAPTGEMPVEREREKQGVEMARWAALCSFLAVLLLLIGPIAFVYAVGVHLPLLGIGAGTVVWTIALIEDLIALIILGAILIFVSMILYTISFSSMKRAAPGFGAPFGLAIVGLIGALLIVTGIGVALLSVLSAVSCAASNAGGHVGGCLSVSALLGGVAAVGLGALLAFIGWIGILIGVYRIGSRYNSTITKVGAILYIIPFVSVVGPILVFVGLQGIVQNMNRMPAAPSPPAPMMPPPTA